MKKLTIDFDGTLCTTAYPEVGRRRWIHKLILWYVKRKQSQCWCVILNTLREDEVLKIALEACYKWSFYPDLVNRNHPADVDEYGESRKIGSHCNIDDMNFGLFGWFLRRMDK